MEKFRKRPVVIEAIQYGPATCAAICEWLGVPHNVYDGEPCGVGEFIIPTLEGDMRASPGDWIIRGVQGEFYPCKPDIFAATYEPEDACSHSPSEASEDTKRLDWLAAHPEATVLYEGSGNWIVSIECRGNSVDESAQGPLRAAIDAARRS